MARGDHGESLRAKSGGFGAVPLGFATDAPRGDAGSFTYARRGGGSEKGRVALTLIAGEEAGTTVASLYLTN
jgi:hypothetical protein